MTIFFNKVSFFSWSKHWENVFIWWNLQTLVDKVVQWKGLHNLDAWQNTFHELKKKWNCWFDRGWGKKEITANSETIISRTQYNQYIMQVLYSVNHFRLMIKILTPSLGACVRSKHTYFFCNVLKYSIRLPGITLTSTERSKATIIFQTLVIQYHLIQPENFQLTSVLRNKWQLPHNIKC